MSLTQTTLAEQLLALEEPAEQQAFIQQHAARFTEADFQSIKLVADKYLRADLARTRRIGDLLIALADTCGDDLPRALGVSVQANAEGVSGVGEFGRAVELYDQAAHLYAGLARPGDQARCQIGKIYALAQLSRYAEAEAAAAWAKVLMEQGNDWVGLARLTANLGIAYSRKGDEVKALATFNEAREYCLRAGPHPNSNLPNIEHNRSLALRHLGRFEESIAASQYARALLLEAGSYVEAARTLQNLATTYFILGRYNEALADLDEARQTFLADGRTRDAVRVDLYISDCLLQLRRFDDVLEKCRQVREQLTARGVQHEVAQAILNEAVAYAGLHQFDQAEQAVAEAKTIFVQEGSQDGVAYADLQQATLLYYQRQVEASVALALHCVAVFTHQEKPVERAYAHLLAARGLLARQELESARAQVQAALALGEQGLIPALAYQCRHLLGTIAAEQGDRDQAMLDYDAAIEAMEHLRGRLMLEFRAAYVEDKQVVYEDAVLLCLDGEPPGPRPAQALDYVERAKSRALLDLLAQRLDLRVQARAPADQPLLDELTRLRAQRDQLYRQWEGSETRPRGFPESPFMTRDAGYQQAQLAVAGLEKRITELWHTLLIRNADYARDAALWHTRSEPIQPLLAPDTLLLEYFVAREQWIVFLVTRDSVQSVRLAVDGQRLQHALRLLRMNMAVAPMTTTPAQLAQQEVALRRVLQRLYDDLIRPIAAHLVGGPEGSPHLVIVPHGPLHYLPFHALHTGEGYLLETFEFSYLPSASFLHYCRASSAGGTERSRPAPERGPRLVAFGHSANGQLPHAAAEAQAVAQRMGGLAFVEEEATKTRLAALAPSGPDILHLAAHADFRADNPLFSGLMLADGWLTTLDIFDLKLPVTLATLSACQTGRSVVGGGDELLGLMRAWISAGAASLVLSYWPIEDMSAARLMDRFYTALAGGQSKRAALRAAQLELLAADSSLHTHPYFWAAYFLVGDAGPLWVKE
jgi:CHAT domain-containing protein